MRFVKKIETGTVFTKTEMDNEWNGNFIQKHLPRKSIEALQKLFILFYTLRRQLFEKY